VSATRSVSPPIEGWPAVHRPRREEVDAMTEPGSVRIALEVDDSTARAEALVAAGARPIGGPVVTPWSHRNVRLRTADEIPLTPFTVLDDA
jgi:hypothetical protein